MPNFDGSTDRAAQHLAYLDDDGIEVRRDRVEALFAGKGQQRFG